MQQQTNEPDDEIEKTKCKQCLMHHDKRVENRRNTVLYQTGRIKDSDIDVSDCICDWIYDGGCLECKKYECCCLKQVFISQREREDLHQRQAHLPRGSGSEEKGAHMQKKGALDERTLPRMTVGELKRHCKMNGIKRYSRLRKRELIRAIMTMRIHARTETL